MWSWFASFFMPSLASSFQALMGFGKLLSSVFLAIFKNWQVILGVFLALLIWALNTAATAIASIDLTTVPKPAVVLLQYYTFMNRFLPLTEAFAGIVIIFNIWLFVTTLRWIKSFVPTISN